MKYLKKDKMTKNTNLKEELIDLVDEYFPKIKPLGGNKGRGEAMVLVARALILFDHALTKARDEEREKLYEFEQKVNQYDISSDGIDDDNEMLKRLIVDCRELLKLLTQDKEK